MTTKELYDELRAIIEAGLGSDRGIQIHVGESAFDCQGRVASYVSVCIHEVSIQTAAEAIEKVTTAIPSIAQAIGVPLHDFDPIAAGA